MASDAGTLDRLAGAADKAAEETRTVYLTFAAFGLYYMVTIGATTHEQLLAGGSIKMPVLDVSLPLVGFFVIVPILFVLLHVNLLLQLRVLARKMHDYLLAVGEADPAEAVLRRKLMHPFVLCQLLAGSTGGRFDRIAMRAVLEVPIVLLPLAALVFTQLRFLPYHSEGITWLHRLLICVDVFVLWFLWPRILRRYEKPVVAADPEEAAAPGDEIAPAARPGVTGRIRAALAKVSLAVPVLGALVLVLSLYVATIPGEWLETKIVGRPTAGPSDPALDACDPTKGWTRPITGVIELRDLAAPIGRVPRTMLCPTYFLLERPSPFLSLKRNLDLRQTTPLPSGFLPAQGGALNLSGRDLRYSDFSGRDLAGADLRGANLTGANLSNVQLANVKAEDVKLTEQPECAGETVFLERVRWVRVPESACKTRNDPSVGNTQGNCLSFCRTVLSDSDLGGAAMSKAVFRNARMERVNLAYASMPGVDLTQAELGGSNMPDIDFTGGFLNRAQLAGARLSNANLQGAMMRDADLANSKADGADMRGAVLASAQLQGADLQNARLDGADLTGACLKNSVMPGASLLGTSLRQASLAGATVVGTATTPRSADLTMTDVSSAIGLSPALRGLMAEPAAASDEFALARLTDLLCEENSGQIVADLTASRLIVDADSGIPSGAVSRMLARSLIDLRLAQCPKPVQLAGATIQKLGRIAQGTYPPVSTTERTRTFPVAADCTDSGPPMGKR